MGTAAGGSGALVCRAPYLPLNDCSHDSVVKWFNGESTARAPTGHKTSYTAFSNIRDGMKHIRINDGLAGWQVGWLVFAQVCEL